MQQLIFIALAIILSLVFGILSKFYDGVPENELKRRGHGGDSSAVAYHQIVKNLTVAQFYLKSLALIFLVFAVGIINHNFKLIWAILVTLGVAIVYLLLLKSRPFQSRLAKLISPIFLKIIFKTKPYLAKISNLTGRYLVEKPALKIYELEDLVGLIKTQSGSKNNRIDKARLSLAISALTFGDIAVKDLMMPKKSVRFVDGEETIGTILIDELHQSGHRHFPVYKDVKNNIVGILDLNDLVEKRMSGKVAWAMSPEVIELDPSDSLQKVLQLFLRSKHQLYIVRGAGDKLVGVLGIDQVLAVLTGVSQKD